jgi:hypothetical protein
VCKLTGWCHALAAQLAQHINGRVCNSCQEAPSDASCIGHAGCCLLLLAACWRFT